MATLSITKKLEDRTSEESHFIELLTNQPNNSLESGFDDIANDYAKKGWTRNYFYEVCIHAINDVDTQSTKFDLLDNFITGLTGECHPKYIIKLPGDPTDESKFLEYVYSKSVLGN